MKSSFCYDEITKEKKCMECDPWFECLMHKMQHPIQWFNYLFIVDIKERKK